MEKPIALRDLDSGVWQPIEPAERWYFGYWVGNTQIVLTSWGAEFRFLAADVVRAGLMRPEWYDIPDIDKYGDNEDETDIITNADRTH